MNARRPAELVAVLAAVGMAAPATAAVVPANLAARVGFDQRLGARLPTDLRWRDETGRTVQVADFLGAAPALVVFTYYGCSNECPAVIDDLAGKLARASLPAARAPQVLVLSFDPRDAPSLAAIKKAQAVHDVAAAARWHFLTGEAETIERTSRAAGFRYVYDDASHQFAHPAGIVVLGPGGRIARYLLGFGYTPRELAQALDDAARRRTGSPVHDLLLLCFHFDPASGRYDSVVASTLQALGVALLVALSAYVGTQRVRRPRARMP